MSTLAHLLVDLMSTAPGLVPIYREHLALHDALLPEVFKELMGQLRTIAAIHKREFADAGALV